MILVLNIGSRSIKWKTFSEQLKPVKEGKIEVLVQEDLHKLLEVELRKIGQAGIGLIGHRVVHGGKVFQKTTKITDENLQELEKINNLAPLHNPYNILGIKACREVFPDVPQFAVFDTEFFSNLQEKVYTYAIPKSISDQFGFRKYGFHGTSHEFVAKRAADAIKKPFNKLNIITCHLGGGASVTAIKNGKAIDTSMGFTPLEGVVMMTRSGNIDAGVVLQLAREFGIDQANEILNKQSGIKGICGEGSMLSVLAKIKEDKSAKMALDVFVYSIQKYIGAYFAILGGCDVLVFTGEIGSGSAKIRSMICKNLLILNKTKILAIKTDEELAIAGKIYKINK